MIRVLYDNNNGDMKLYLAMSMTFKAVNSEGVLIAPTKENGERYVYIFDILDRDSQGNQKISTMCVEIQDFYQGFIHEMRRTYKEGIMQISRDLQPIEDFLWDNGAIPANKYKNAIIQMEG